MEGKVEEAVALLPSLNYEVRGPGELVDAAAAAVESESEFGDGMSPA